MRGHLWTALLLVTACGGGGLIPSDEIQVEPIEEAPLPLVPADTSVPVSNALPVPEVAPPLPPGKPLDFAIVGSALKVRPQVVIEGERAVKLIAARNEFESFQIVVRAKEEAYTNLTVAMAGPLKGPGDAEIPVDHVFIYRVGYLPIVTASDLEGGTGRWPDPLVPMVDAIYGEKRNAFPANVPLDENRVAWVDVLVPIDAVPGVYTGSIDLSSDDHFSRIPVELEVVNLTLPSTTSLKSSFGYNGVTACDGLRLACPTPEALANVRDMFVRIALDNRMTIASAHPKPIDSAAGLAAFRKHAVPFIRGTANTRLPGAKLSSYQTTRLNNETLGSWKTELASAGLDDGRAFAYICDEPHFFPVFGEDRANWIPCKEKLAEATSMFPEIPKLVSAHIQSSDDSQATDLLDIMVVNVELLDGPVGSPWFEGNQRPLYDVFLALPDRHREVWMYAACGSHGCTYNDRPYTTGWAGYEVDAPASEQRAIGWLGFTYGLSGTLYYDTILTLETAWEDQYRYTGNGEGNLFYPGTPDRIGGTTSIPIESLRMKHVRDGYEEYEYLKALRDSGRGTLAREIARGLFPATYATSRTDAQVQAAHRRLAEAFR